MGTITARETQIPNHVVETWQRVVDILARVVDVPAALIMRVDPPEIEVFSASRTPGNPYEAGARDRLTGLYCETVMRREAPLLVPNAVNDPEWCNNPDIKLGMIAYSGLPIFWPGGELFGTICVLDKQENQFGSACMDLMKEFKDLVETHMALVLRNEELETALSEIETLRGIIPICAWCKKVRDDTGFWQNVDAYVEEHTLANFTHGICPSCDEKL